MIIWFGPCAKNIPGHLFCPGPLWPELLGNALKTIRENILLHRAVEDDFCSCSSRKVDGNKIIDGSAGNPLYRIPHKPRYKFIPVELNGARLRSYKTPRIESTIEIGPVNERSLGGELILRRRWLFKSSKLCL